VINPSQRPLPNNTQHSQQTNTHAPCGIRTHNLSRRAAENLRLRPRGHWDRLYTGYGVLNNFSLFHEVLHVNPILGMFAYYQLRGHALDVSFCSGIRIEIINRSVNISGTLKLGTLSVNNHLLICFHSVPEWGAR
jgi:hypothetical protein